MNNAIIAIAVARLKEPSSWSAIAVALTGAFPALHTYIADAAPYVIAVCVGLGIGLPEKTGA